MTARILITCDGINCVNTHFVEIPGWLSTIDEVGYGGDSRFVFCPDCEKQAEFFDAQCAGCVESFPNCGLGRSLFEDQEINGEKLAKIRSGVCPFRTNGTLISFSRTIGQLDLSKPASPESGQAVVDAIESYLREAQ